MRPGAAAPHWDQKLGADATASGVATGPQELASGAIRAANAMLDRFPHRGR